MEITSPDTTSVQVSELVRLLRGQVRVQSAVGTGTHVIITLPTKEPTPRDLMDVKLPLWRLKQRLFS